MSRCTIQEVLVLRNSLNFKTGMSTAYKILPHYTYADYLHWEGKWELIDGIPYAMSPAPKPRHQAVAGNLHAEFRAALKKGKCGCTAYQPIDYKISEDTVLNPDLLIVCKPIEKAFLDFPPDLVAEILSPATALKDRHTKFEIYQQQQVPYYLIIDTDRNTLEVFQLVENVYQQLGVDEMAPFTFQFSGCSANIVLNDIWQ